MFKRRSNCILDSKTMWHVCDSDFHDNNKICESDLHKVNRLRMSGINQRTNKHKRHSIADSGATVHCINDKSMF